MSEGFKPINSQEEFDAAIGKRLERERTAIENKVRAEFTSQLSEYESLKSKLAEKETEVTTLGSQLAESQKSAEGLNAQIADLQKKVSIHETNSVKMGLANKYGIPAELANKISGETVEEMEADAEKMKGYIGKSRFKQIPLGGTGENIGDEKTEALRGMLSQLKGE